MKRRGGGRMEGKGGKKGREKGGKRRKGKRERRDRKKARGGVTHMSMCHAVQD